MRLIRTAALVLITATTLMAETYVIEDDLGNTSSPIELKDGSQISIRGRTYTISKEKTEENQILASMRKMILPEVDFRQAAIRDILEFLTEQSKALGQGASPVQFVFKPFGSTVAPITFSAENISLYDVADTLCELANLKFVIRNGMVLMGASDSRLEPFVKRSLRYNPALEINDQLKEKMRPYGVTWPEGSWMKQGEEYDEAVIFNTVSNVKIIDRLLSIGGPRGSHVEIEVHFVEFDLKDIERLAAEGMVTVTALNGLRKEGKTKLIAAPRVITKSGQQATVKGVVEYIYPTDFSADYPYSSNSVTVVSNSVPIIPGGFQTREAGALLEVLPEVSTEGDLINLTLTPQVVYQPEWHEYVMSQTSDSGGEIKTKVSQPFFEVSTVTTSVTIENGGTILLGGGMPRKDIGKIVYCFVHAQLVDTDGSPIVDPF